VFQSLLFRDSETIPEHDQHRVRNDAFRVDHDIIDYGLLHPCPNWDLPWISIDKQLEERFDINPQNVRCRDNDSFRI